MRQCFLYWMSSLVPKTVHDGKTTWQNKILQRNTCYNVWTLSWFLASWWFIASSNNGLAPNRHQTIISTNDGLVYWRIYASSRPQWVNTLRPRQNGRHFPDDIFKCIFLNENEWISINISLKFVPKGQINNIPSLVLIMAWRRPGDKPLSEAMVVSLLTHICVARPQWVKVLSVSHCMGLVLKHTNHHARKCISKCHP